MSDNNFVSLPALSNFNPLNSPETAVSRGGSYPDVGNYFLAWVTGHLLPNQLSDLAGGASDEVRRLLFNIGQSLSPGDYHDWVQNQFASVSHLLNSLSTGSPPAPGEPGTIPPGTVTVKPALAGFDQDEVYVTQPSLYTIRALNDTPVTWHKGDLAYTLQKPTITTLQYWQSLLAFDGRDNAPTTPLTYQWTKTDQTTVSHDITKSWTVGGSATAGASEKEGPGASLSVSGSYTKTEAWSFSQVQGESTGITQNLIVPSMNAKSGRTIFWGLVNRHFMRATIPEFATYDGVRNWVAAFQMAFGVYNPNDQAWQTPYGPMNGQNVPNGTMMTIDLDNLSNIYSAPLILPDAIKKLGNLTFAAFVSQDALSWYNRYGCQKIFPELGTDALAAWGMYASLVQEATKNWTHDYGPADPDNDLDSLTWGAAYNEPALGLSWQYDDRLSWNSNLNPVRHIIPQVKSLRKHHAPAADWQTYYGAAQLLTGFNPNGTACIDTNGELFIYWDEPVLAGDIPLLRSSTR